MAASMIDDAHTPAIGFAARAIRAATRVPASPAPTRRHRGADELQRAGIAPGPVRTTASPEDPNDLTSDRAAALHAVRGVVAA
jgi:hypothetical protein